MSSKDGFSFTEINDSQVWDDLVLNSDQGSFFNLYGALECLEGSFKLYGVADASKKIRAGAAVLIDPVTQLARPQIHPLTQFQGVLLRRSESLHFHSQLSEDFRFTEFLIEEVSKIHSVFAWMLSWRQTDIRPFLWHNYHEREKGVFQCHPYYTAVLATSEHPTFEDYLGTIRSVRRQEYKKAQGQCRVDENGSVDVLMRLHELTFERQGLKASEIENQTIQKFATYALKNGFGKIRVAWIGDRPASANLFVEDSQTSFYLVGANDPEFRNSGSGTLLTLTAIQEAFMRKKGFVDFVGINSPRRGDFKLSFNPKPKLTFVVKRGACQ